jgi:hypothetical protein
MNLRTGLGRLLDGLGRFAGEFVGNDYEGVDFNRLPGWARRGISGNRPSGVVTDADVSGLVNSGKANLAQGRERV